MSKKIKPFSVIGRFGSKTREIKYIEAVLKNYIDKESIFIDVFGGSGIVGIHFMISYNITTIYNDIDKDLCNFMKTIKETYPAFRERYIHIKNIYDNGDDETRKKIWEEVKNRYLTNTDVDSLDFFLVNKLCFRSLMIKSRLIPNMRKKNGINVMDKKITDIKKLDMFHEYTQSDFRINNKHYKDIMLEYKENKKAVLYLDPPYIVDKSTDVYENNINMDDIYWIVDFMKTAKCLVCLNIDYNPVLREFLLKDMLKDVYYVKYNVSSSKNDIKNFYQRAHCIFCNSV